MLGCSVAGVERNGGGVRRVPRSEGFRLAGGAAPALQPPARGWLRAARGNGRRTSSAVPISTTSTRRSHERAMPPPRATRDLIGGGRRQVMPRPRPPGAGLPTPFPALHFVLVSGRSWHLLPASLPRKPAAAKSPARSRSATVGRGSKFRRELLAVFGWPYENFSTIN